jgi:hypothetical protein
MWVCVAYAWGQEMAALSGAHMSVVREFLNSIFMRMKSGDLDLDEGMVEVVTAISNFDAGTHADAINYMWTVIAAEVP